MEDFLQGNREKQTAKLFNHDRFDYWGICGNYCFSIGRAFENYASEFIGLDQFDGSVGYTYTPKMIRSMEMA